MTALLSRAALALAVLLLGEARKEWALAMQAEFEAARAEGNPLGFALGCLGAAVREMPAHEEGRFAIASHLLALVVAVPVAALLVSASMGDFPSSYFTQSGEGAAAGTPLVNEANRAAVPSLAALVVLAASAQLRLAWLVLERDWTGAAAVGSLIAAATVTLIIFTALVFDTSVSAFVQGAVLTMELAGIAALARWDRRAFGEPPEEPA